MYACTRCIFPLSMFQTLLNEVPCRCECREVHFGLPWILYACIRCIFPLSLCQTLLNEVPRRCACREVHGETATENFSCGFQSVFKFLMHEVPRRCECREVNFGLPWTLYACMRCIFPLSLCRTLLLGIVFSSELTLRDRTYIRDRIFFRWTGGLACSLGYFRVMWTLVPSQYQTWPEGKFSSF